MTLEKKYKEDNRENYKEKGRKKKEGKTELKGGGGNPQGQNGYMRVNVHFAWKGEKYLFHF